MIAYVVWCSPTGTNHLFIEWSIILDACSSGHPAPGMPKVQIYINLYLVSTKIAEVIFFCIYLQTVSQRYLFNPSNEFKD